MSERISYWLIPVKPDKKRLQQIICELAAGFNAPVFEPHVTLYSGEMDHIEDAADVLEGIAGNFPIALRPCGTRHSGQFTKTLFMEFASDSALDQISDDLKLLSKTKEDYELKPHLSLLYATISPEMRQSLARELAMPEVIRFDCIQAVVTSARTQTKRDVEEWRMIAKKNF